MARHLREVRVFISSPRDVAREREGARRVVRDLNDDATLGPRFGLRPLLYEDRVPAAVGESPQRVVDRYMGRPRDADIFVCILWHRMGTPILDEQTAERFDSGTAYEFEDAYRARTAPGSRRPEMLLYRCTRKVPDDHDAAQRAKVEAFFREFTGDPPRRRGLIKSFDKVGKFEDELRKDLERVLDLFEDEPADLERRPVQTAAAAQTAARARYLQELGRDVEKLFRNSIQNARFIDIDAEEQIGVTHLPWLTSQGLGTPQSFRGVDEAFAAFKGRMLILGDPGSGKSTTLLHLAQRLIESATSDPAAPLPLRLNLSEFTAYASRQTTARGALSLRQADPAPQTDPGAVAFRMWIEERLAGYPGVTRQIAAEWLDADRVALLLDGLDEVDEGRLREVAHVLNSFLLAHHECSVVVCSRTLEYRPLSDETGTMLKLKGAVTLQPLSAEQINEYLEKAQAVGLRDALPGDTALYEMARNPLTLSMITMAYAGLAPSDLPAALPLIERRRHLFDTYVDRMMQRAARRDAGLPFDPKGGNEQPTAYSRDEANRYLGWLAVRMSERSQTVLPLGRLHGFLKSAAGGGLPIPAAVVWADILLIAMCTLAISAALVTMDARGVAYSVALSVCAGGAYAGLTWLSRRLSTFEDRIGLPITFAIGALLLGGTVKGLAALLPAQLPMPALAALVLGVLLWLLVLAGRGERWKLVAPGIAAAVTIGALAAAARGPGTLAPAAYVAAAIWMLSVVFLVDRDAPWRARVRYSLSAIAASAVGVGCMLAAAESGLASNALALSIVVATLIVLLSTPDHSTWRFFPIVIGLLTVAGALWAGPLGGASGAFAGLLIGMALSEGSTAADFVDRHVLSPLLRVLLRIGRVLPLRLERFLRYAERSLLLKRIGDDWEFSHRLLRDHFAVRELTLSLTHPDLARKLAAIARLRGQGSAAAWPLIALASDGASGVRRAAVASLSRLFGPEVIALLESVLSRPGESRDVREAVFAGLQRMSLKDLDHLMELGRNDLDPSVRAAAVRTLRPRLGGVGSDAATAYLQKAATDPAIDVRRAVVDCVSGLYLGEAHILASLLSFGDMDRDLLRGYVLGLGYVRNAVGEALSVDTVSRLLQLLRDPDTEVRRGAAMLLGAVRSQEVRDALAQALHDEDDRVKGVAADGLARFAYDQGNEPYVADLIGLLGVPAAVQASGLRGSFGQRPDSPNATSAAAAARALGNLGARRAAPALLGQARAHPDPVARAAAVEALGRLRAASEIDLVPLLGDRDAKVRAAAANAIRRLEESKSGVRPARPHLLARLKDRDSSVVIAAIGALQSFRDPSLSTPIARLLRHWDWRVRTRAAEALGRLGDPSAIDRLTPMLKDSSNNVRREAVDALAKLNAVTLIPLFEKLLDDRDPWVRSTAAKTLQRLMENAEEKQGA